MTITAFNDNTRGDGAHHLGVDAGQLGNYCTVADGEVLHLALCLLNSLSNLCHIVALTEPSLQL